MLRTLGLALILVLALRAQAFAATYVVDRTDDDASAGAQACTAAANDCSLRGAILKANSDAAADTITLPTGVYTLSIAGADEDAAATGDLDITHDLEIDGNVAATTIIDGASLDRVFQTDPAGTGAITVTIKHVTIQHGNSPDGLSGGGGIRNGASVPTGTNVGGTLNLVDVVVSTNQTVGRGGGISNDGVMTITDSIVDDNTSMNHGGGIVQEDEGSLTISHSFINSNHALNHADGGGLFVGLFSIAATPQVTIDRVTISNNDAGTGGGIARNRGTITLTNSTISGNTSTVLSGGGIADSGGYVLPMLLVNCTVSDNTAPASGGGIANNGITGGKETELANTIVAGNHATTHVDYEGTLLSQGYNLIGDANGVTTDPLSVSTGDQIGVANPHLGALANNGGFGNTHALLPGSPAIDAGNPAASDGTGFHCQPTDQIGTTRPVDGDGSGTARCDIGAFEVAVVPTTPTPTATKTATPTSTPTRTATPLVTATHTATPSVTATPHPTATATPGQEDCSNCIDDDGNTLVDRADPSCALPTGGGLGLGDAKKGKALVKCAGAIQKAGAKLEAKRLARLQKCVDAAFACAQVKNGDSACLAKASGGCDKAFAALSGDEAAFAANVGKKCDAVAAADLTDLHGLGYTNEDATCRQLGAPTPTDAATVAACVAEAHACRADAALGVEVPRAAEMLGLVGRTASALPCLPAGSGAGAGLGDAKTGKLAAKCEQAAKKAGAKLIGTELKTMQKCATTVFTCIQTKPNDAKCLPKAQASCTKSLAKITDGAKGIDAKLAVAVEKSCGATGLALADVLDPTGVGFRGLAGACAPTGADVAAGVPSVAQCLATYHKCRAGELLEAELPRVRELLGLVGVTLP